MTVEKTCPECNGDGTIIDEIEEDGELYTEETDCPECNGTGVLVEDHGDAPA